MKNPFKIIQFVWRSFRYFCNFQLDYCRNLCSELNFAEIQKNISIFLWLGIKLIFAEIWGLVVWCLYHYDWKFNADKHLNATSSFFAFLSKFISQFRFWHQIEISMVFDTTSDFFLGIWIFHQPASVIQSKNLTLLGAF